MNITPRKRAVIKVDILLLRKGILTEDRAYNAPDLFDLADIEREKMKEIEISIEIAKLTN